MSDYVTIKELEDWLKFLRKNGVPDDTKIKVWGEMMTDMHYHEMTGVSLT